MPWVADVDCRSCGERHVATRVVKPDFVWMQGLTRRGEVLVQYWCSFFEAFGFAYLRRAAVHEQQGGDSAVVSDIRE